MHKLVFMRFFFSVITRACLVPHHRRELIKIAWMQPVVANLVFSACVVWMCTCLIVVVIKKIEKYSKSVNEEIFLSIHVNIR